MKIWQITIRAEEDGRIVEILSGLAETAQEAIMKAVAFAESEGGHKNPYPSSVTEIGKKVF